MAESFLSQLGDFTIIDNSQSPLNGVIFHHVQTVYPADEPVKCVYSLTDGIEPEMGDTISLFKVGWISSSEAFSSIPAKLPLNKEKTFLVNTFDGHLLPNDSAEMYQFCYVTRRGVVGASTPFTFESNEIIAVEDPLDPGLLVFKSRVTQLKEQLLKLSDEKSYYKSKFEVQNENFMKLKAEFDKIELELLAQKEMNKRLEVENAHLSLQILDLTKEDNDTESDEDEEPSQGIDEGDLSPEREDIISSDVEVISDTINSGVWKSLYEICEVAAEIQHSLKSNDLDGVKMSYQALINYILDVFSAAKKKFQIKGGNKIDESKYCNCYYQQRAFCCPRLCNETQFQYMMAQPLYTCFSNFTHYTKDGALGCDGSFDPITLNEYVLNITQRQLFDSNQAVPNTQNSTFLGPNTIENNIPPDDDANQFNMLNIITEERDKATIELKETKEKIATLNSRVNVLELELVAQQANQQNSLIATDIESILESVYSDFTSLKGKYNDLCKKISKTDSVETKCAALEKENRKLLEYFSEERDQKINCDVSDKLCADLGNLIAEKEKAETKLFTLQKESVGKISVNLIHQEFQGRKIHD